MLIRWPLLLCVAISKNKLISYRIYHMSFHYSLSVMQQVVWNPGHQSVKIMNMAISDVKPQSGMYVPLFQRHHLSVSSEKQKEARSSYRTLGTDNFKKEACVFYLRNQHMHTPYTQHYKFHPSYTFCTSITHQVTQNMLKYDTISWVLYIHITVKSAANIGVRCSKTQ